MSITSPACLIRRKRLNHSGFLGKKNTKTLHFCFVKLNKDFESSGSRFSDTLWSGKWLKTLTVSFFNKTGSRTMKMGNPKPNTPEILK